MKVNESRGLSERKVRWRGKKRVLDILGIRAVCAAVRPKKATLCDYLGASRRRKRGGTSLRGTNQQRRSGYMQKLRGERSFHGRRGCFSGKKGISLNVRLKEEVKGRGGG